MIMGICISNSHLNRTTSTGSMDVINLTHNDPVAKRMAAVAANTTPMAGILVKRSRKLTRLASLEDGR